MAKNTLLINVDIGETRVGLIADGVLRELYVERRHHRSPVGNIYLGRVQNVLPGMEAAFVDIGTEKSAFLHVSDVSEVEEDDDDNGRQQPGRGRSGKPVEGDQHYRPEGAGGGHHDVAAEHQPVLADLRRQIARQQAQARTG